MRLFGTDGVRGEFGHGFLDIQNLNKLFFATFEAIKPNKIIIGLDTRSSSEDILEAIRGYMAAEQIINIGVVPSAVVSHFTKTLGADIGIMITASHNTYEYNGVKFFAPSGEKISHELEQKIEEIFFNNNNHSPQACKNYVKKDILSEYISHLKAIFPNVSLSNKKIIIDSASGSAYGFAKQILESFGADALEISPIPNGYNINEQSNLEEEVIKSKAYCGLRFDGDADRLIMVDEAGVKIDGDDMLAFLSTKTTVVGTQMTNQGLVDYLSKNGIKLLRANVGERNVFNIMLKSNSTIGGEPSGHIIPLCYGCCTSDAIVTALHIFDRLGSNKPSYISNLFKRYNQYIAKAPICDDIENIDTSYAMAKLGNRGRINIRKSGTEPIIRIMLETDIESLDLKEIANGIIRANNI